METNIYLVRHAHSSYSSDEYNRKLSERGYKDAERVTKILSKEKIDYVISSPYKRAQETVEGISKLINKDIIIHEGFRERLLSKAPLKDFNKAVQDAWDDLSFSLEGGESGNTAQKRGVQALWEILNKYEGKNIAIGTHGNIMVLIMNYFDKKYDYSFWRKLDMPDIYKLSFDKKKLTDVNKVWHEVN